MLVPVDNGPYAVDVSDVMLLCYWIFDRHVCI
jgi:hypothetical protein